MRINKYPYTYPDLLQDNLENPKCENCGKILENAMGTHCSDECLFDSIKNSKPFPAIDNEDSSSTNSY